MESIKPQITFDPYKLVTDKDCNVVAVSSCLYEGVKPYPNSGEERYPHCDFKRLFETLKSEVEKRGIKFYVLHDTKDVWCRDYMPVQFQYYNIIPFYYRPEYLRKNPNWKDMMTSYEDVRIGDKGALTIKITPTIVADGGNIVKSDIFVIMTEQALKDNRNLYASDFDNAFGTHVVFIPSAPDRKEFCKHSDGVVRYVGSDTLLLRASSGTYIDEEYLEQVKKSILQEYPYIKLLQLNFDTVKNQDKRNWCYINFLRIGNVIFLPVLGDNEKNEVIEDDAIAIKQFADIFPMCEIVPIYMGDIVKHGGALNCLTWTLRGGESRNKG